MATRMQQRRGTAAQWISTNGGNGPVLNGGEIGYETDTNKFKIGDGTNHWVNLDYFIDANSTTNPSFGSSITFEGSTANDYETTLAVTDPTADRTITLPNATGTVVLADGSGNVTVSGDLTVSGTTTTVNSTILEVQNEIKFEGTTANEFETSLIVVDPTADRTVTIPDATGTIVLADNTQTLTNKTLTSPKINEDVVVTATATELNYVDGVTSAIQTQLNNKQAIVADVSDTEIGYLNGVTSAIQTQLDAKIAKADITAKGAILVGTGAGTYSAQAVGTNGQVLTANSAEADGVEWTTVAGYSAPTLGSTSVASGATVTTIAGLTLTSPVVNSPKVSSTYTAKTDAYTFASGDEGNIFSMNNAATRQFNIPTDDTFNFAVGTEINVFWITGAGQPTIGAVTPGTTTVISTGATSATPKLRVANSGATCKKLAANSWIVFGDLS
jgi:hypothetical protein